MTRQSVDVVNMMTKEKKIKVVELFAGVGGFRVGFERCDKSAFETVWANQWEPGQAGQWAFKCYEKQFGSESHCVNEDIATVIDEIPEHELLVGGFPCQDYSVAATGAKGIEGKKGVLWWSIDAIVRKYHPSFVLLENVDRLLKSPASQRGRDFGIILKCLEIAGYAVEWRVINAADYGNVQRRRRTFIFACREGTKQYKRLKDSIVAIGGSGWLHDKGFFAGPFPVRKANDIEYGLIDLEDYKDLLDMTDRFQFSFLNSGVMLNGKIYSEELIPEYQGKHRLLSDIICKNDVPEKYFIKASVLPDWEYMKGAKKISRKSRTTGFEYTFSEGAIPFPDPLDRPARTMLTSEGSKNRSTHVIEDYKTKRLRILTPEECERINGFDDGWTDTGMPERQRYFIMGNALVVPLIEKMGARILEVQ